MARLTSLTLALCVLFSAPSQPAEPTRAAPIYSLPEDGSWVEYDWTGVGPDGWEIKGVLRISSVGTRTIDGVTFRWVEVCKQYGRGDATRRECRKFLVPVKAFATAPTLRDHVTSVIGQDDSKPSFRLSSSARRAFLELGLAGKDAALKEVRAREKVEVPLGTYEARHVRARRKVGERMLEYQGWLTADVLFGCARFEILESEGDGPPNRVFSATAARAGRGTRSELNQSKAP